MRVCFRHSAKPGRPPPLGRWLTYNIQLRHCRCLRPHDSRCRDCMCLSQFPTGSADPPRSASSTRSLTASGGAGHTQSSSTPARFSMASFRSAACPRHCSAPSPPQWTSWTRCPGRMSGKRWWTTRGSTQPLPTKLVRSSGPLILAKLILGIGKYVVLKGQRDLLENLQKDEELLQNESMKQGLADLDELFTILEYFDALHSVSFDLSLARGMFSPVQLWQLMLTTLTQVWIVSKDQP